MKTTTATLIALVLTGLVPARGQEGQGPTIGSIVIQRVPVPPRHHITGGPGDDELVGTNEDDQITDPDSGDADVLRDAPVADGVPDVLDARDQDDYDFMWGGPEDFFVGDPGDTVCIRVGGDGGGQILWCGTFTEYLRLRALMRRIQDGLQALLNLLDGDLTEESWRDALDQAIADAHALAPDLSPEPRLFSDVFEIGPYELVPPEDTQPACLSWCPFGDSADPVAATATISLTDAQFQSARAAVVVLLEHALDSLDED